MPEEDFEKAVRRNPMLPKEETASRFVDEDFGETIEILDEEEDADAIEEAVGAMIDEIRRHNAEREGR